MSSVMRRRGILVEGVWLDDTSSDDRVQELLAAAHSARRRPMCGCGARPELYVAKVGDRFVVKRMPGSGGDHEPGCESWSPSESLTGIGRVLDAVRIREDGLADVRLDFSLSKRPGKGRPPAASTSESKVVRADGAKMTLHGLLCWLWDEAGMTSWSPGMVGKRSWRVVSWYVRGAATDKQVRGGSLAARVWLPEPFHADHKREIAARREEAWRLAREVPARTTQLMVLVGEVKKIDVGRFGGHLLTVRHAPDAPIVLDEDLHRRMQSRFADELELWNADPTVRLVVAATFSVGRTGTARAHELTLITMTEQWLPFASVQDRAVLDAAVAEGRRFAVGQKYGISGAAEVPIMVLTDTEGDPVPVYVGAEPEDDPIGIPDNGWRWSGDGPLTLPAAHHAAATVQQEVQTS